MGDDRPGHGLYILGGDEVPALYEGVGLGGPEEGQGAPGAYAQLYPLHTAGGLAEGGYVAHHYLVDVYLPGLLLKGEYVLLGADGFELRKGLGRAEALQNGHLLLGGGGSHGYAHEEAVQLGLGQGIGAKGLHRVLGGDNEEGGRQLPGDAVNGDGALGHAL